MLHYGWNLRHCTKWTKPITKRQILWFHLYTEKILMLGKIEGKRRRGQQRMRLDSITKSMNMNLSKLRGIVEERGAWLAIVRGVANSQTWLSNRVTTKKLYKVFTVVKITETESRMVVPMGKEKREIGSHGLMSIESSFKRLKESWW